MKKLRGKWSLIIVLFLFTTAILMLTSIFAEDEVNQNQYTQTSIESSRVVQDITIDTNSFPDDIFRKWILDNIDSDKNGILSPAEQQNRRSIIVTNKGIKSLKGIEYFTELRTLSFGDNDVQSIDVSVFPELRELHFNYNKISSIDLSQNTKLTKLSCGRNLMTSLDLSHNTELDDLYVTGTLFPNGLDVSHNKKLTHYECYDCDMPSVDLSQNTELVYLYAPGNHFTELDVSQNTKLKQLYCQSNQLKRIDLSHNPLLEKFECHNNQLTELNVSHFANLTEIICCSNQLVSLDVSGNEKLTEIIYYSNPYLTHVDFSGDTALETIDGKWTESLESIDVSDCVNLKSLDCSQSKSRAGLKSLDLSHNIHLTKLDITRNRLTYIDLSNNKNLTELYVENYSQSPDYIYLNKVNTFDLTTLDSHLTPGNFDYLTPATATLDGTILKDIELGKWVKYSIDLPLNKKMTVNLAFVSINDWEIEPTIQDWTYNEMPQVPTSKALFGNDEVIYQYSDQIDGTYTNTVPSDGGVWYMKALVPASGFRSELISDPIRFEIKQAMNNWNTNLTIENWQYGEKAKKPITTAKFGNDTIVYRYSKQRQGDYSEKIPSNAGTWYVKAIVPETANYKTLESDPVAFQIEQANNEWIKNLLLDNWEFGEQAKTPSIKAKFGNENIIYQYSQDMNGIYRTQVPTEAGTYYVKALIPQTANYTQLESLPVSFMITQAANQWQQDIVIDNWIYNEKSKQPSATAKFGTENIKYVYSQTKAGQYVSEVPIEAGIYYVKAIIDETQNYTGLQSTPVSFQIMQAQNQWEQPLYIADWTYGSLYRKPISFAKFGADTVTYQYSQNRDGQYTTQIPTEQGTWYVKAIIEETHNYSRLETISRFRIIYPEIVLGANQTYIIGSQNPMVIKCTGILDDLTGVYVDDYLISEKNYLLKSGSTIVTLKSEYLDSLLSGKHNLKLEYGKISVETSFEIIKNQNIPLIKPNIPTMKPNDKVNMGDEISIWMILGVLGESLLMIYLIKREKTKMQ